MLVTALQSEGVPVIEMRPSVLNFSDPMKTLDGIIRDDKIAHNGDPVMTWMIGNVVAKYDAKDNVYPRKQRPQDKIDGPVALIMALARALSGETASAPPAALWL
jgi:phage terminase large subunit-like protein